MIILSARRPSFVPLIAGALMVSVPLFGACAPTIKLKVEPISIYAKLDHDVRIHLDEDVKALVKENPNLF